MKKVTVKDWNEIQSDFEQMSRMSCVPSDIRKVPGNHIFDENQSVKWNREKVEENNRQYVEEVARLNTAKNKCRDSLYEDIYTAIKHEVGHNLSRAKAILLWNYAYEQGHSAGISEVMIYLRELMELADKLLTKGGE